MTQDFLRRDLNALNLNLSHKTLSCLYALKPAIARKLLHNGTALKYDQMQRKRSNTFSLPNMAHSRCNNRSFHFQEALGDIVRSGRRTTGGAAGDIDRNLFFNKNSIVKFDKEQARIGTLIGSKAADHMDELYNTLDNIQDEVDRNHHARSQKETSLPFASTGYYSENNEKSKTKDHLSMKSYSMKHDDDADIQTQPNQHRSSTEESKSIVGSGLDSDVPNGKQELDMSKYQSVTQETSWQSGEDKTYNEPSQSRSENYKTLLVTRLATRTEIGVDYEGSTNSGTKEQENFGEEYERKRRIKPSTYRSIGWQSEMGPLIDSKKPTSYIEEFTHPKRAENMKRLNLINVNGYVKNKEINDLERAETNKALKIKEARHEFNQGIRPEMKKERRRREIMEHIRDMKSKHEYELIENELDEDCESISTHSSEQNSLKSGESFKQLLDDVPLRNPTSKDYMFVASQTLPRELLEEKLLRMQERPCANNIHTVSKEIEDEIQKKRVGRRLLKQRIENLAGFDDIRARLSVERDADVNHIINFAKERQTNAIIEEAKAEIAQEKCKQCVSDEERVKLDGELVALINKKLKEKDLPPWEEVGNRRPRPIDVLFMTDRVRPMENLVQYRRINNIGMLHKPFLVDYRKDKVTGETIAIPKYIITAQTCPGKVLDRFRRLSLTGVFNADGEKHISAGHEMQKEINHQNRNKSFLQNVFCDYIVPKGSIEHGVRPDYFDSFYGVLNDSFDVRDDNKEKEAKDKIVSQDNESTITFGPSVN